jgi:hypothetical protein
VSMNHHGEFDEHKHDIYMMHRLSALHNNQEDLTRNVSELKKIKKRKVKRLDSKTSRKSSLRGNKPTALKRITNVLRAFTLKK